MNTRLSTLILAVAVAPAAFAQYSDSQIRIGAAFSLNSETRRDAREFLSFGLQHKISDLSSTDAAKMTLHFSVDIYNRGDYRHVPLMLNYVVEPVGSKNYYSFGAGIGFVRQPILTGTESVGRIAYSGALGRFFTDERSGFAEIRFFGSGAPSLNTVAILFGVRF